MAIRNSLFAETVAGMKRALKRRADESDSDSEIDVTSNRGNKLKKKARYAHRGQLAPPQGPSVIKETVEYLGLERSILYRKAPLLDEDGFEIDSEDDDERVAEAELTAAQLDPYADLRLERILAPLTASTDLPTHATLSKPFASKTLTSLVAQSCEMMRRENNALWRIRPLWTALCGDGTWMPCGSMVGADDMKLYTNYYHGQQRGEPSNGPSVANGTVGGFRRAHMPSKSSPDQAEKGPDDHDEPMSNAATKVPRHGDDATKEVKREQDKRNDDDRPERGKGRQQINGSVVEGESSTHDEQVAKEMAKGSSIHANETQEMDDPQPQLQLVRNLPSSSSQGDKDDFIHSMFLPPEGSRPDRNIGLPEDEAEDLGRLLALYVQKQEEVCRGATKLHHGLLKAERLRHEVLRWAKSEAHCGTNRDMSDGEDWYDREEWGLEEDLKKGQDEDEEDTTTTGKKIRTRR